MKHETAKHQQFWAKRNRIRRQADYHDQGPIHNTKQHYTEWLLAPQFLEVLEPALEQAVRDLPPEQTDHRSTGTLPIARQAAGLTGYHEDAILRRLYDAKKQKTARVSIHIGDALLVAIGETIYTADLHVFPVCPDSAQEMVEAWELAWGRKTSPGLAAELLEIAKALNHKPFRKVVCTPEALQIIGGESKYLLPTTSLTNGSPQPPSSPPTAPARAKKSGSTSSTSTPKRKRKTSEHPTLATAGSATTLNGSSTSGTSHPTGPKARSAKRHARTSRTSPPAPRTSARKRSTVSSAPSTSS